MYPKIHIHAYSPPMYMHAVIESMSTPDTDCSLFSDPDQLKFHAHHGRNACLQHNCLTAYRPNAAAEFNDAIVMSNRPLRDGELFEVVIEKVVERWSGSLEAGMYICLHITNE